MTLGISGNGNGDTYSNNGNKLFYCDKNETKKTLNVYSNANSFFYYGKRCLAIYVRARYE